jgi:hypothetical protein
MSRSSVHGSSPTARGRLGSPSPPPRRPCHRDGGWQVIVERVIEKSTAGIVYPMLTRTNYTEWSAVMHMNLQTTGYGRWSSMAVWSTATTAMHWRCFFEQFRPTCKLD